MKADTLLNLYIGELQDLYNAEKQLLKALPKMQEAASTEELAEAFGKHLIETNTHVERLETIIKDLGKKPGGEKCEAMKGLITEGDEIAEADGVDNVRDAGIIVAAQKVEHYEIAGYGSMCAFAKVLGRKQDLKLLTKTLEEEKAADAKLSELADGIVNVGALEVEA